MEATIIDINVQEQQQLDELALTINELYAARKTIDIALGQQLAIAKAIWLASPNDRRRVAGWQDWVARNLPFSLNKANDLIDLAATLETDDFTWLDVTHLHSRAVRVLLQNHVTAEQRREIYEVLQSGAVVNEKIARIITSAPSHVVDAWRGGTISVDDGYAMILAYGHAPNEVKVHIEDWGVIKATTVDWLNKRYVDYVASGRDDDKAYGELLHNGGVLIWGDEQVHISQADRTQLDNYMQARIWAHIDQNSDTVLWDGPGDLQIVDGRYVVVLPDSVRFDDLATLKIEVKVYVH